MRADSLDVRRYLDGRRRLVERALAARFPPRASALRRAIRYSLLGGGKRLRPILALAAGEVAGAPVRTVLPFACALEDRKSTRLNSSHLGISYAVFCLKKKNTQNE